MLETLKAIDALPYAVSQGIVLNSLQLIILFSGITVVIIFFASKRKRWLVTFVALILLFQVNVLIENYRIFNQKAIIIYNTKNLIIHLIEGRKNYLVTNSIKNLSEPEKLIFERARYNLKLNPVKCIEIDQNAPMKIDNLHINKNRIQFINSEMVFGSKTKTSSNLDLINLAIYSHKTNAKLMDKNIYTGNSGTFGIQEPEYFRTKLNGAFYADLNME